jgi:hypothetical protein
VVHEVQQGGGADAADAGADADGTRRCVPLRAVGSIRVFNLASAVDAARVYAYALRLYGVDTKKKINVEFLRSSVPPFEFLR